MGQKMPAGNMPTSSDIRNYIKDMTLELAVMAARAGHFDLAQRLGEAVDPPTLPFWPALDRDDSERDRTSRTTRDRY